MEGRVIGVVQPCSDRARPPLADPGTFSKRARELMEACRVPRSIEPGTYGPWEVRRLGVGPEDPSSRRVGWEDFTVLTRHTAATLHQAHGDVVMEDSIQELSKHLPILTAARGRVLVSGLGMGCVVRGLASKPEVDRVDVVEIDPTIIRVFGTEVNRSDKVVVWRGDALKKWWPDQDRWDFAWHDLWTEDGNGLPLTKLHLRLIHRFRNRVRRQGAWALPREFKLFIPGVVG